MDKHGAMAHMLDIHIPIYGAMAQRYGLQRSYGIFYGSREPVKAHGAYIFLWHFMFFNDTIHKIMDHDWYVDDYVLNLNEFKFFATLGPVMKDD